MKLYLLMLINLSLLVGCSSTSLQKKVKTEASFLFDCPEDQITTKDIGDSKYGASGCGKRAVYFCDQIGRCGQVSSQDK